MRNTVLSLNEKESRVFFDAINSEQKCLVNEYDDDTGRRPGKGRMENLPALKSVISKWKAFQPKFPKPFNGTYLINLEAVAACELELSGKEITACKNVLRTQIRQLEQALAKYEPPFTGALADMHDELETEKDILARLCG